MTKPSNTLCPVCDEKLYREQKKGRFTFYVCPVCDGDKHQWNHVKKAWNWEYYKRLNKQCLYCQHRMKITASRNNKISYECVSCQTTYTKNGDAEEWSKGIPPQPPSKYLLRTILTGPPISGPDRVGTYHPEDFVKRYPHL